MLNKNQTMNISTLEKWKEIHTLHHRHRTHDLSNVYCFGFVATMNSPIQPFDLCYENNVPSENVAEIQKQTLMSSWGTILTVHKCKHQQ